MPLTAPTSIGAATGKGWRLHPRFVDAWQELPPDIFKQTAKILDRLQRSPQEVLQLKGCKKVKAMGAPVFECRINKGYRLTFMLQPAQLPYLLLVGHHDDILEDTKRMLAPAAPTPAPAPEAGADASNGHRPRPDRRRLGEDRIASPLKHLSDDVLSYMGIPAPLIPVVRGIADQEAIYALHDLPEQARECLLAYFLDGEIRRPGTQEEVTATELVVQAVAAAAPARSAGSRLGVTREWLVEQEAPPELVDSILRADSWQELESMAMPFRLAQRIAEFASTHAVTGVNPTLSRDRYADDGEVLEQYYRGELKDLLLHLTEEQRPLLDLRVDQVHQLKGVAGSGKTTVAIYLARRLVRDNPAARVLFLTYTNALARSARELVTTLAGDVDAKRIEVKTFHKWVADFLGSRRPAVIRDATKLELIASAITSTKATSTSKLLERSPAWFADEISDSIKGRGLQSLEEYLAVERVGRATALAAPARRVVWDVYLAYQEQLGRRADWDDYPLRAHSALATAARGPRYHYVIVDEAQDLSPMALRVALGLTDPDARAGLLVADAAQSIYRHGFRWRDVGVAMHGSQVHRLTNNHRNTHQILAAANAVLADRPDLRDDGEGAVVDANTPRQGPLPRLVQFASNDAEATYITTEIQRLRRTTGLRWGNIAVLTLNKWRVEQLTAHLRAQGIPCQLYTEESFSLRDDTVKLITMHSAKGLEFPVVFVTDVNAGVLPRREADPEAMAEAESVARRLLYVAMTRSMQELTLTTRKGNASPLLASIPASLLQVA